MDLLKEINREHSTAMRNRIVAYLGLKKSHFAHLVEVFLAGPYRVTQRAAWPLSYCVQKHPELIIPHLGKVLAAAEHRAAKDAVKRNVIRLLQFIEVPGRYRGRVADLCFRFLKDRKEPIAVRAFAMTVLGNLTISLPELGKEVSILIEDELPYGSAGFVSRGRKVLKQINHQNSLR